MRLWGCSVRLTLFDCLVLSWAVSSCSSYADFSFLVLLCCATSSQMYMPDKFKIVILAVLSVNLTRTYSVICKKLSKDLWFLAQDIEKTHPKAKNFLIVPQCGDLFTARTELKRLLAASAISSPKYFLFLYQKSYIWKLPSINAYLNKNKKNKLHFLIHWGGSQRNKCKSIRQFYHCQWYSKIRMDFSFAFKC